VRALVCRARAVLGPLSYFVFTGHDDTSSEGLEACALNHFSVRQRFQVVRLVGRAGRVTSQLITIRIMIRTISSSYSSSRPKYVQDIYTK
jgi:hypothetical protein